MEIDDVVVVEPRSVCEKLDVDPNVGGFSSIGLCRATSQSIMNSSPVQCVIRLSPRLLPLS